MPKKDANKIAEDKTFGMKNKNKSKKVQQFMTAVKKSAEMTMGPSAKVYPLPHLAYASLSPESVCNKLAQTFHRFAIPIELYVVTDCVLFERCGTALDRI